MIAARIAARISGTIQEVRRRRRQWTAEATISEPTITVTVADSFETLENNRRGQPTSTSLSLLYLLCKQWAWNAVTFRCETHPDEASAAFRDENGDTALHWVVFGNPPLDVIEALLNACPALASTPNDVGNLPIHVAAAYRASGNVVRALVKAYPEGCGIPASGKSTCALHLMCDYGSSVDSIRAVLESESGVASLQYLDGTFLRTPVQILNLRKNMHFYHRNVSDLRNIRRKQEELREAMLLDGVEEPNLIQALEDRVKPFRQDEFWQKASLLICAEYTNSILHDDTDLHRHILNACTMLWHRCPISLTELALLLHPEQLQQRDGMGRLPLHNATRRPDSTVLLDLLNAWPQATKIPDAMGFLPLHLAIRNKRGWNDGVGQMLMANPEALEGLDLDDRLYPRIWYKLQKHETVDALYESVRATPSLLIRWQDV
jgi:ankyrin repeat protein